MTALYDQIQEAARAVRAQWAGRPRVGIILGTGLGGLAEDIAAEAAIPYQAIPHFPHSTAPTHAGRLVCGRLADRPVVAMEGRFHFYEGYSLQEITLPVRVMQALGLKMRPSHFVAFMPEKLEQKLFKLELEYEGLKEDQIDETKFEVVKTANCYEPRVIDQTPKSGVRR